MVAPEPELNPESELELELEPEPELEPGAGGARRSVQIGGRSGADRGVGEGEDVGAWGGCWWGYWQRQGWHCRCSELSCNAFVSLVDWTQLRVYEDALTSASMKDMLDRWI